MDKSYAAAYPDLYRRHWWWRVREEIVLGRIAVLLREVPRARILDVGCGAGLFFDALQRFGEVEGIESDATAVENAGKWRNRIHHGQLDETFTPSAPYDLILMLDVLEHLDEPVTLLHDAALLLAEGGRILVTVPAFNWLWTKHDDLNHHVRRFTMSEMKQTIAAAGLAAGDSSYLFPSLVLPKMIARAIEAVRGSAPAVPEIPPAAVNRTVEFVLRAEHTYARWVPFGTSLMAVASRGLR
jgi:SAM-dependent methyltransferase